MALIWEQRQQRKNKINITRQLRSDTSVEIVVVTGWGKTMVNQRNIVIYFIVSSLVFFSLIANAEENANDKNNYVGDRISFPVDIDVTYTTSGLTQGIHYCIPAKTTLMGLSVY